MVEHWTRGALDCHFRKSECKGCLYKEKYKFPCLMYLSVKQLIEKFGLPSEEEIKKIYNSSEGFHQSKNDNHKVYVDEHRLLLMFTHNSSGSYRFEFNDVF